MDDKVSGEVGNLGFQESSSNCTDSITSTLSNILNIKGSLGSKAKQTKILAKEPQLTCHRHDDLYKNSYGNHVCGTGFKKLNQRNWVCSVKAYFTQTNPNFYFRFLRITSTIHFTLYSQALCGKNFKKQDFYNSKNTLKYTK